MTQMNSSMGQKQTPVHRVCYSYTSLLLPRMREGGKEMDWEFGVSEYKPLYRERINNNVLLYSRGNNIQYPVINHSGKECVCVYVSVSVCVCVYIYIYIYTHIYIFFFYNRITLLYSRN